MQKILFSEVTRPGKNNTSISACPESLNKWFCLNGATCFQVKIYDAILYNCWCPSGYQGLRCDYKYVERKNDQNVVYNKSLETFKSNQSTKPDLNNKSQLELSTTNHHLPKQTHIVAFNLLILSLILLALILLLLCVWKRRSTNYNATIDDHNSTGTTINVIQNTEQNTVNNEHTHYDNLSTRLDVSEQKKRFAHSDYHRFVIRDALRIGQLGGWQQQQSIRNQLDERKMLPNSLATATIQ